MLPSPPHNFILYELDFDAKFPLLRLKSHLKQDNVAPHPHTTLSCMN